jgi:hypothetical protein
VNEEALAHGGTVAPKENLKSNARGEMFVLLYHTFTITGSSGSSSPLCLRILKEGSRVRQKHNSLVILFIAAIATTCFDRAWSSSGHNVDVYK